MTTVIDKDKFTKIAQITIAVLIVIVLLSLLIFFLTHKGKKTAAPVIHASDIACHPSEQKNSMNLDLDAENNKSKTEQSNEEKIPKINEKRKLISGTITQNNSIQQKLPSTLIATKAPKTHLTSKNLNKLLKPEMEINIQTITFDEIEQQWNFGIEDSKNHINEIPYSAWGWGLLGYKNRPTNIEQDLLDIEKIQDAMMNHLSKEDLKNENRVLESYNKIIGFIKLILMTKKLNPEEMTEFCQILNHLEPQKPTPTQQQETTDQQSISSEMSFHSVDESLNQQSTTTTTPNNRVDDSIINKNSSNVQKG